MSSKEKANELVKETFEIIANASNYKGVKNGDDKKFGIIEDLSKKVAINFVNEIINVCPYISKKDCETVEQLRANDNQFMSYWEKVKQEIKNL